MLEDLGPNQEQQKSVEKPSIKHRLRGPNRGNPSIPSGDRGMKLDSSPKSSNPNDKPLTPSDWVGFCHHPQGNRKELVPNGSAVKPQKQARRERERLEKRKRDIGADNNGIYSVGGRKGKGMRKRKGEEEVC